MKVYLTGQRLVYVALAIFFAIVACNFQGYNISIRQVTPGETIARLDTIAPVDTVAPVETITPAEIATPVEATPTKELEAIIPVTGSLLRWVDFSDFVFVPQGEFIMGEDKPEGGDTVPMHTVSLSGFWIHQAEVTNKQYALCVDADICTPPKIEADNPYRYGNFYYVDYPVVSVDWFQAQTYCNWIKGRLPTEAEWEKTGRGTEGSLYPWGDAEPNCTLLNFDECLDPPDPNFVDSYMEGVSTYDAFDISGNVFEWTNDWYAEDSYTTSAKTDPTGPELGKLKVFRGGSYLTPPEEIKLVVRSFLELEKYSADLGFRCVLGGEVVPPPPICQVAPVVTTTEGQPETPPVQLLGPEVRAYCAILGGGDQTVVEVELNMDTDAGDYEISLNGNPVTCTPFASNPSRLTCTSSILAQNSTVQVQVCRTLPIAEPVGDPECPSGYTYNPSSTFCEYGESTLPSPPCPKGYLDVPGVGCMPVPVVGSCPDGFYKITLASTTFCVPLDPCLYPGAAVGCTPSQSCLPSFTYITEQGCCAPPSQPQPVCPVGYEYYERRGICIKRVQIENPCDTFSVYIPACPTETPPPPRCYCCQFTNFKDCAALSNNRCVWRPNANPPYCAVP
jgi:sulfatase modifying factor 1